MRYSRNLIWCDWKETPDEVINEVNKVLKDYKLKFKEVETLDDSYEFKLIKIK